MHTGFSAATILVLGACLLHGQATDLPPGVLFVSQAKRHIAQTLTAVPNYTCLETIARERLKPPARAFERLDLVRLEVARADKRELFSWPGAGKFEEKPITDFVGGGLIGDGAFSLFAEDLFLNGASAMKFRGPEKLDGRSLVRIDYSVSALRSKFTLVTVAGEGQVSYSGSFWVDPGTLDLVRLDIEADDIPPQVQLSRVRMSMEYGSLKTAGGDASLARTALIEFVKSSGEISRDEIEFTRCRKFAGEATLSFDPDEAGVAAAAEAPRRTFTLPGGLTIALRLRTPIDAVSAGVGDEITAEVERDVTDKGRLWLPKGTLVQGRIRRLEGTHGISDYVLVGLEFSEAQTGRDTIDFIATLQSIGAAGGISMHRVERKEIRQVNQPNGVGSGGVIQTTVMESFDDALPGVGYLYLTSVPFTVAKDFSMTWKTLSFRQNGAAAH